MNLSVTGLFPILLGAAALFFGTANPIMHLPLVIVLYPATLYAIGATSPGAFRRGWWTGLLGASPSLYWIAIAVHDYGEFPWPMAVPCAVLLGMYVGLWGGLFARAVAAMRVLPTWRRCLAAAVLWYILEWTRGWFFTGFPWLTLAAGQAAWPVLVQAASLVGAYGLSGLLAGLGCLLAEALGLFQPGLLAAETRAPSFASASFPSGRFQSRFGLGATALTILLIAFGVARMQMFAPEGTPLNFALIQGNMRQDLKWEPMLQQETVDKYLALSRKALNVDVTPPDVVIWPETAMPFYYQNDVILSERIRNFARSSAVPLVFGGPGYTHTSTGRTEVFNRAFFVDRDGHDKGQYDKEHLVPFGEFMPPWFDFKIFAMLVQGVGGFTPGRPEPLFRLSLDGGRPDAILGMLICYEGIFPELARQRVADGATVLVNISNDAWYNKSSAAVQHLYHSLLRAVEQGRWLARSTNTGLTVFVDPLGRMNSLGGLTDGSGLFISAFFSGIVYALDEHTVYFTLHTWLPLLAFSGLLIIVGPLVRLGRTRRSY